VLQARWKSEASPTSVSQVPQEKGSEEFYNNDDSQDTQFYNTAEPEAAHLYNNSASEDQHTSHTDTHYN
jgi:hypothetical protein